METSALCALLLEKYQIKRKKKPPTKLPTQVDLPAGGLGSFNLRTRVAHKLAAFWALSDMIRYFSSEVTERNF
jgi:hypothetical protein